MDRLVERVKERYNYRTGESFAGSYISLLKWRGLAETHSSDSFCYKKALAFKTVCHDIEKKVFPEELIVGWLPDIDAKKYQKVLSEYQKKFGVFAEEIKGGGQAGHFAPNYRRLLKTGLKTVHEEVCAKLASLDPAIPENISKIEFLNAAKITLEEFKTFCQAYAELTKNMARKSDIDSRFKHAGMTEQRRKKELLEISRICAKVPWEPAESFQEALQAIFFIYLGLLFDIPTLTSFGRLDRYLEPYLKKDLAKGKIDWEFALRLMRNFCAKVNEFSILPQSVMVGGRTADGKPYFSSATKLVMEAIDRNRLLNPALGVACCKNMAEYLWEKSVAMLADGFGHPALFGDETITGGLIDVGVSIEDACEFVHCTCTEITIPGRGYIWVTADYINFPKVFEYIWYQGKDRNKKEDGVDTGGLSKLNSFNKMVSAVKKQLANQVYRNTVTQNRLVWRRMQFDPNPFASCLVDDCIKREEDITRGGAIYNFLYPQLVGLANVTDGLLAIKNLVYENKRLSLSELKTVLEKNFIGFEPLRQGIINKMPKYGTDDDEADKLASELAGFYCSEVLKYRTPLSRYYPGFLVWRLHLPFGQDCMATPDGRREGTPLADSLAAMQGQAKKGITAILNSAIKLNLSRAIGAAVVNLHVQPSLLETPEDRKKFADLLKAHFQNDGFEVQVTVVSAEELEKAITEPEKYRDLIVRVGGYNDYFTRLDPELQRTIIERARRA
ncbi:MAG: pyruvate formate lyase family protein [Candidatus Omnitrophota bacterium]